MTSLDKIKGNLSKAMQERLDKWRKQTEPPKMVKTESGNMIQHRDYGDHELDWHQREVERNREYHNRTRNIYGR